jgi:hypothetical protein
MLSPLFMVAGTTRFAAAIRILWRVGDESLSGRKRLARSKESADFSAPIHVDAAVDIAGIMSPAIERRD